MLTKVDYKNALWAQDACNLSGVAHSFSRVMSKIWDEADRLGKGTDWVNTHPIAVLYASKIASLSGSELVGRFEMAYAECERLAETEETEA